MITKGDLMRWAELAVAFYDRAMERSLGFQRMRTYYSGSGAFLREMNARYWKLEQKQLELFIANPPVCVLGEKEVDRFLQRCVKYHALRAAFVTFLCALPSNWLMWPLMLVDIVFFQREVFLFSQEAYMMYRPRTECRKTKFDYVSVTLLVAKMLEPIVVRQAKSGLGIVGKMVVKRGVKMFRLPLQVFLRQSFKWLGVAVTKEAVEKCIDMLVLSCCALIAGFVSYWLFIPMANRMKRSLGAESLR